MNKILIVTNTISYPDHASLSRMLCTVLTASGDVTTTIDMNSFAYDHQCFSAIQDFQPTVLITLDLAGFRLRTQSGECALNILHCKCLNFIWGNKPEYKTYLQGKLSLSMLFYDVSGEDHNLPKEYPNMLYYHPSFTLLPSDPEPAMQNAFMKIWQDFSSEVLLSEALS